jgi:preprotein translocase subunit SecA
MVKALLTKVLGDPKQKQIKAYEKVVAKINDLEDDLKKLSDKQLKAKVDDFKKQIADGKKLDDLLVEVFAVVREASSRTLKMRHFDVQLVGGIVLYHGNVAEMRTGEGKTLVATLPVVLNALTGKGAHVVTVNDYLAKRDAGWNGALYDFLGLSVGVIVGNETYIYDTSYVDDSQDDERLRNLRPVDRKEGYAADITYGTNNEFGFDYLRDNMVRQEEQLRQRDLHFAIVDEVDSILIDEARTPLIISAPSMSSGSTYTTFAKIARQLKPEDYELDEKRRAVSLNDEGVEKVQKILGIDNLYAPDRVRDIYHMEQALRAETLFKKDKDYVVSEDDEVIIVDEFTGRLMHGRRYNEGLHQAIEAKEGVEVLQESMTLATISFQNYFRLYEKLAGMTGTAMTEEEEFQQIYNLDVYAIPTNMPIAREDKQDRIYKTQAGKFRAIVSTVKELHEKGQPVLLGTASIEKNELLSSMLKKAGVPHNVLNAKNNEREAAIVAGAGNKGAVTLATNIAGRGTDIKLDKGVTELGGLFVLGSERHEARRIDNQLRGRAGRQGDPGVTQFFVSAEDDLMRIFGGERIAGLMTRLGVDDETPIENKALSKALESAQKKVESHNFDSRKHVVQYDDVMNKHRKSIYSLRQDILRKEDISDRTKEMISQVVANFAPTSGKISADEIKELQAFMPLTDADKKKLKSAESDKFIEVGQSIAERIYAEREKVFTPEVMRKIEREIFLQVVDNLWMQHLEDMTHLREGISWQSVGQKDPLVEYRRQSKNFFEELKVTMASEIVRLIYFAQPQPVESLDAPVETELTKAAEVAATNSNRLAKKASKTSTKDDSSVVAVSPEDEEKRLKAKKDAARKKKKQSRKNRKKGRK